MEPTSIIRVQSDLIFDGPREVDSDPAGPRESRESGISDVDQTIEEWESIVEGTGVEIARRVAGHEPVHASRDGRAVLVIPSGVAIPRGERVRVLTVNPVVAFRPDRITLVDAQDWVVHDVRIGDRSQIEGGDFPTAQLEGIPGVLFSSGAHDSRLQLETAQMRMTISVDVTYVGPASAGVLTCVMLGLAVGPVVHGGRLDLDDPETPVQATP